MIDERFVVMKGPLSLSRLAEIAGARLIAPDPTRLFGRVAPLDKADGESLSFCHNTLYTHTLTHTQAGAVLISGDMQVFAPSAAALLICDKPLKSFTHILSALYQERRPAPHIHPTAIIHPTAQVGDGCSIGAGVVLDEGVTVGPNCTLEAHAVVGAHVTIGEGAWIGAHVSLSHAHVGRFVTLKPGARIGQRGFGFFMGNDQDAHNAQDAHVSQLQLGRVIIGDHVEIGANTTIDRGSLNDTVIETGARIDNLVQVAHNVHVGRGAVLVAQVGIAGSTRIGDFTVLAGQVGVAGHLTIGNNVKVAAKSGLNRSLADGQTVGGYPAVPIGQWHRQVIFLQHQTKTSSLNETLPPNEKEAST